jgi:hypothetical protein
LIENIWIFEQKVFILAAQLVVADFGHHKVGFTQ